MRLTIDPGVELGWATWNMDWQLINHGVFIAKREPNIKDELIAWKFKADQIGDWAATSGWLIEKAYIEYPSNFGGGGVAAQNDSVIKLAVVVGMIIGNLRCETELIPVNRWKGQMSKAAVIKRIKRLVPGVEATSHDADAIGIGLYKKGVF